MPNLPPMRAIYSSHVDSIGHDPDTNTLFVKWDSGKVSAYDGVPPTLADEVSNSWSVGKALTAQIKSSFPHRYV
jgi:hypothetical protein